MRKSQVLDSRVIQGLWSEPIGPFIFGFEAVQEGLQSQFWFSMSCASYKRSWTVERGKVTEIYCEKGQCNASKEKAVTTEQESM
jgi:hypothetical protein